MATTIQQRLCGASRAARPSSAFPFHAAAAARSGAAVGTPCGMPRQVALRSVAATAAPKGKSAAPAAPAPAAVRAPKKKSRKLVDINGDVDKDLGNGMFKIKLENGVTVMAHLSGKIRQNRIKIVMGDKVTVELSPYDLTKGRITYRYRPGEFDKLQAEANAAASAAEEAS